MYPSYLNLHKSGELKKRIDAAYELLKACALCPHKCGVNRLKNQKGRCKTGLNAVVSSFFLHQGEEPPISGSRGSGTIFFTHCTLRCAYCQNYKLSQKEEGREAETEEIAGFMLKLQNQGAHNINLVTPTHIMPQILKALFIAADAGLRIPIIYNTSGYELVTALKLLEGVVDIYLPDMRYADNAMAEKYSQAPDYPVFNRQAIKEMQRQVSDARINKEGIIEKGLIIRHLVLPNDIAQTEEILIFIKNEVSANCHISLMSQYFPCYKTAAYPEINRRITCEEYLKATGIMARLGLNSGWAQESGGLERFAGLNIKPNI